MTPRRPPVAANAGLLGAMALLAACAAEPVGTDRRADTDRGDICAEIASAFLAGQRDSFGLSFAEAETRMRSILVMLDDAATEPACPGGVSRSVVLAELGLSLSGQRKFRLADGAFAEARAALARQPTGTVGERERARLDTGRIDVLDAQHALNQRNFADADSRSRVALEALGPVAATRQRDFGDLVAVDSEEHDRLITGLSGFFAQSAALSRTGQTEQAQTAIASAIELAGALPGVTGAMRSRLQSEQALNEIEAGRPEAALAIAREAAEQLASELPNTPLAGRARLIEAAALARLGRSEEAFNAFETAFDIYADSPAALEYESIWPFIRLAIERGAAGRFGEARLNEGVFRAAQLVRTASAAGDIAQAAAQLEAGTDAAAAAVRDWRAAREELLLLTTALSRRDLLDFEREALNRRFVEAAERASTTRARRDRIAPEYRRAIDTPVMLGDVQGALRPGELMLQILVGAPRSTLILVSPERVRVATSIIDGDFADAAVDLLRTPMQPGPDGRYPGFPAGVAQQIHDLLLGPLADEIAGADKVFVSATGALQGLPLEMLVTREPDGQAQRIAAGDYSGVAWLGAQTTFSYLPSPRNLVDLRGVAGMSAGQRTFMGFGDFDPGPDPAALIDPRRRASCAAEVALLRQLPRLPGTAREIARIEALLGAEAVETLTGRAFTEDALKRLSDEGALRDFRVVHFATHGLLWPTTDCFEPALSASVVPGLDEDGLIESGEIRALDLDAQLVVLSACQSTDPAIADAGENLSGLARAFFTAGTRSVIASHWVVDDEQTAALMEAFYRRIGDDRRRPFGNALAEAAADLRAAPATSHPVFWAPFVLLGDGTMALGGA